MTPRPYDYDDGFDEAALHDDDLMFEPLKRRRNHRERAEETDDECPDEEHLRRKLARLKTWGAPY